ncbi:MAG: TonB-dependent receptor, partial [Chloroflexota bacterium]
KDPVYEFEASLRGFVGSRDNEAIAGIMNLPFSDEFAVRATFDYEKQESWRDALAVAPNENLDNEERTNYRIKLLHEPDAVPGLSSLFTFQHNEDSGPQTLLSDPPFALRQSNNAGEAAFLNENSSGVHELSYDTGNGVKFTNIFQLAESTSSRDSLGPFGSITLNGEEIGNETRINFEAMDGQLNGVFGFSWLEREEGVDIVIPLAGFSLSDGITGSNESIGAFGEFTYDITEDFDVSLGGRWQQDNSTRNGVAIPILGIPTGVNFDETFSAFLPKVSVGYDVNEELRIGALYSQGYNPGGVNLVTSANFALIGFNSYNEETSDNFEVFLRSSMFEGALELTANAFYTDFESYQARLNNINNPADPNDDTSEIINIEGVETYGLELNADAKINEQLQLNASIGLLRTEITENVAAPATVGNELLRAPSVTASLGVQIDVTETVNVGGRVRYVGEFFGNLENTADTLAGDYTVLDLNASWKPTENFEAFAFVNNVFDEDFVVNAFGVGANRRVGFGDPLEAGFGIQVKF